MIAGTRRTKKQWWSLAFGGILPIAGGVMLLLWAVNASGGERFVVHKDGSIQMGGLHFADFAAYTQSDYFREHGMRCGTRTPDSMRDGSATRAISDCTLTLTIIQNEYWPSVTYVLPVWFHVIYRSDGTGNISETRIREQVRVLNEDFRALQESIGSQGADTGIQFALAGITRTRNDAWFDDTDELAYKQALNRDPSSYVNIYTNTASGYLGYSYFPQGGTAGRYYDGIVMNYAAIGGRDNGFGLYDQGRTLVHEMGHYFGLFHTFEGYDACNNSYSGGDLVVDTPAEEVEHFECIQTFTCGSVDPISNYMNYTPDVCMNRFSMEQANRAVCALVNYRPKVYSIVSGPGSGPDGGTTIVPSVLTPLLLRHN